MSAEMDNLNADIDRLIAEAEAERDDSKEQEENKQETENENTTEDNKQSDSDADKAEEKDSDKSEEETKESADANEDNSGQSTDSVDTKFEAVKTTVDGQEITLDSKAEVEQFIANQNRNIHSDVSTVEEIVKQANISQSDLQLLADIKAGKIGAMNKLAKDSKMDLADVDEFEGEYTPEFQPEIKSDVDKVLDIVAADAELAPKFNQVISSLPDDFLNAVGSNASDLQKFVGHIESGLAQELLPQAIKASSLGNGSVLENYIKLGEAKFANGKKSDKAETKQSREVSKKEQELRERASSDADKNKGGKSSDLSVEDLWNEDDLLSKVRSGEIDLRNLD